jgi:hypothetical protein
MISFVFFLFFVQSVFAQIDAKAAGGTGHVLASAFSENTKVEAATPYQSGPDQNRITSRGKEEASGDDERVQKTLAVLNIFYAVFAFDIILWIQVFCVGADHPRYLTWFFAAVLFLYASVIAFPIIFLSYFDERAITRFDGYLWNLYVVLLPLASIVLAGLLVSKWIAKYPDGVIASKLKAGDTGGIDTDQFVGMPCFVSFLSLPLLFVLEIVHIILIYVDNKA